MRKSLKNSKSLNNPTLSKIRAMLREASFNPRVPGPMKIVSEQGNSSYFECRAMELISEAIAAREAKNIAAYQHIMTKAIQLVALAKINESSG